MLNALIATAIAIAAGQTPPASYSDDADALQRSREFEGIWPTPTMLDRLLERWVDETAHKFDLTEQQTARFARQVKQRWPAFLDEHRHTLQPLINEYIESRLGLDPPDADQVRQWADRAEPVFDEFRANVRGTYDGLSEFMTPPQKARLSIETIKINTGLHLFEGRLETWRQGRFEESDWWDPPPSVRRARATARRAAEVPDAIAPSAAKAKIDEELQRWDFFVAHFVRQYRLDDRQSEAAFSILRECKQKVSRYVDRYRARIEHTEKRLSRADVVTDELRQEAAAVYGPIDAVFADLTSRMEQIPTRAQEEAAKAQETGVLQKAPTEANPAESADSPAR